VIQRVDHQLGFVIQGCPPAKAIGCAVAAARITGGRRTPNAILEQWPRREASLEATIAKEEQWAAASVKYLRTLIEN